MIFKKIFFKIFILTFFCLNSFSEEIEIESSNINVVDDGKIVLANNAQIIVPTEKIKIKSDLAKYEKTKNIITFTKNVLLDDRKNEVIIDGDFIKYERKKNLIYSKGKTKLQIKDKYKVNSKNISFMLSFFCFNVNSRNFINLV